MKKRTEPVQINYKQKTSSRVTYTLENNFTVLRNYDTCSNWLSCCQIQNISKMPGKGGHRPQNLTKIMKIKNLNHDHRFSINELS